MFTEDAMSKLSFSFADEVYTITKNRKLYVLLLNDDLNSYTLYK